jgi:hypothetical protein
MDSNSVNAPLAKGSEGAEAAGKTGERETNASNLFEAPQAAEERETNAPCQREAAENMGTRETNVSKEETAAPRRDGKPPTNAEQRRRQGVATAAERLAAGDSPNPAQEGATIMDTPQTTSLVMGRRLEGIGPTQRMLSEPEHQRVRRAGAGQPAAADARDVS